jgi:plasmid maintenance system antidote protein VapI
MLRNDQPDMTQAIGQLREVLALELPLGLTNEFLIQLQNAIELAEQAIRAERRAREGFEFSGE